MEMDDRMREIYSRQIMMKEIGEQGQQNLVDSSVLVIGCGGLGAPVLYYLTAMGIGHLGLCDNDTVALSNLNRQILFTAEDIGKPKASTARKRLIALNPNLRTTVYDKKLDKKLAESIIPSYDIIVDCLDNFETRFIINDVCVAMNTPFVHGGIGEFYGQLLTVTPGRGPCLRCLFPDGVKEKKQFGVIGPTPGIIGAVQAMEVVKYLLGMKIFRDALLVFDGTEMSMEKVPLKASENCICTVKSG